MARKRRKKSLARLSGLASKEPAAHVRLHIARLGLSSKEEYRDWCRRHGFGDSVAKSRHRCDREWLFLCRQRAEEKFARSRKNRDPARWIEPILRGEVTVEDVPAPWQRLCQRLQERDPTLSLTGDEESALRLFQHVDRETRLLHEKTGQGASSYAEALFALCRHADSWRRPVESWRRRTHNASRQFPSLARHLYAEWPLPAFLDHAWFESGRAGLEQQRWFRHLGRGGSVRALELPLAYNKRMAHHFLLAPDHYSIPAALRFGQILGLGGSARLAEAVRGTRLVESFEHDDFWKTVLTFLILHPQLRAVHVGPVVDYLHDQRFEERELLLPSGRVELEPPPQPRLSMRGRSPERLLRQVDEWHGALGQIGRQTERRFEPSGFRWLRLEEGSEREGSCRRWILRELLSTRELVEEGRAQRHCVASYGRYRAGRDCSIWTLEKIQDGRRQKVLTIEVRSHDRVICQARGKCNANPTAEARRILRQWADREGLEIASYV